MATELVTPTFTITMINNTDYQSGAKFITLNELKDFIKSYYRGVAGDRYAERWIVEGDYPNELFDLLSPPEIDGDVWHRR